MGHLEIRELRLPEDSPGVRELDTSFTTGLVYAVVAAERGFRLVPTPVEPPVTKRFALDDLEDPRRAWERGCVAVEGGRVCGLLGTAWEEWNRRLVIRHLYVDRSRRRRGIGGRLVDRALAEAVERGAATVWLETSSLNYPGVQAYRRLGFELCGLDTTLYRSTAAEGETALFFARSPEP